MDDKEIPPGRQSDGFFMAYEKISPSLEVFLDFLLSLHQSWVETQLLIKIHNHHEHFKIRHLPKRRCAQVYACISV